MSRDIHDYDSLKEAYDVLLMFERFPGPVQTIHYSPRVREMKIKNTCCSYADCNCKKSYCKTQKL